MLLFHFENEAARLSDVPRVTQWVRGRAGIQAQAVWLQSMGSGPKCSPVSALPFWKDVNKLVCMAPTGVCVCTRVNTHAHTRTSVYRQWEGRLRAALGSVCVLMAAPVHCGSPGSPYCALLPSLPCGSQETGARPLWCGTVTWIAS